MLLLGPTRNGNSNLQQYSYFWEGKSKTVSHRFTVGLETTLYSSWVSIGVVIIGASVAAPNVVMGVIGAMGLGSGGIVAGSKAASMMSAHAIASGGAIAAGGTVATLQSIGAAGLGAAAVTAAIGAGASWVL